MNPPLILIIDDNATTRKVVENYLTQAGYRLIQAASAERGLELATEVKPDLILLDHQLPGTTGDTVCRQLLASPVTSAIPVVVCSAMRNKAFVQYADFANVVDQLPKPFTPELLKSGVANALHTGALVVRAQKTGSTIPELMTEEPEPALQGTTSTIPLRAALDFLNRIHLCGRLAVEVGNDLIRFSISSGRVQAVYAPAALGRLQELLPADLADLAPLLPVTLAEQQDSQMSSLVKLLEHSFSDPKRLRALLRFQSTVLTYWALTAEPGTFRFDFGSPVPPIFQAVPLNISVAALAVEGVQRAEPIGDPSAWAGLVFRTAQLRFNYRDFAGLSAVAGQLHSALDGTRDLRAVARESGLSLTNVILLARGLEVAGLVERNADGMLALVIEDDRDALQAVKDAIQGLGGRVQWRVANDTVSAQLLMRRTRFDFIILPLDNPQHEQTFLALRALAGPGTCFVGLLGLVHEEDLIRLDSMGLDAAIERPIHAASVLATLQRLIDAPPVRTSAGT